MASASVKINTTVLIAPLDWGLGHATRCIPIIQYLLQCHCRVIIASSGPQQKILEQEFPQLTFIPLAGYNVLYAKKYTLFKLLLQAPSIFMHIKEEHSWLQKIIKEHGIDAVISDNRYGLWCSSVPCVLITHQLQVQAATGFKWMEGWVRKILYHHINQFANCWLPDEENIAKSMAPALSHPRHLPKVSLQYIGWLSRFAGHPVVLEKKYLLTICLSGPEPQRSILENILLGQIAPLNSPVLLVRGLPQAPVFTHTIPHLTVANHLPTAAMQVALLQSQFVLSRCGYSTLMDMQVLNCHCIFIPTPAQTEQQYLAKKIAENNWAVVMPQHRFSLANALKAASVFRYHKKGIYINDAWQKVVDSWLLSVRKQ